MVSHTLTVETKEIVSKKIVASPYFSLYWRENISHLIIYVFLPVSVGDYVYDAFVSYCGSPETDRWVVRELLSHVETRMGFHLCVHHRDFIPGDSESYHHMSSLVLKYENSQNVILNYISKYTIIDNSRTNTCSVFC